MTNPVWFVLLMSGFWPRVGVVNSPPIASVGEVRHLLLELFDPPQVIAILPAPPEARVLVIAGDRAGIQAVRRVLSRPPCCEDGGAQLPVQPIYLEYADARALVKNLEPALPDLVGLGPVRIIADVPTNSLIVEASEADFAALAPLIAALDKPPFPAREFALPRVLVAAVAAANGGGGDGWAAYCHVVEGWRCFPVPVGRIDGYDGRFDAGLEAGAMPVGLSRLIILVVDPRHVEHARGNGVKLRCGRGGCAIDRGWGEGWERVGVAGQ